MCYSMASWFSQFKALAYTCLGFSLCKIVLIVLSSGAKGETRRLHDGPRKMFPESRSGKYNVGIKLESSVGKTQAPVSH